MNLGNIFTDIEEFVAPQYAESQLFNATACGVAAGSQTPELDSQIADLSASWNPASNYFSAQDISDITAAQQSGPIAAAYAALTQAYTDAPTSSYPNVTDVLDAAQTRLNNVAAQTINYITAYKTAQAQNAVVSAPGLKAWALETLAACQQALQATFLVECSQDAFAQVLSSVASATGQFASACKAIASVIAQAGQAIIQAAETAFSLVQWIAKYWLWLLGGAVVVGLGFLAFKHRHRLSETYEHLKEGE